MKKISKRQVRSAGIVVVRKSGNQWLYLLLRAYRNLDFPKGRVEGGEDLKETAIRETQEETSITSDQLSFSWGNQNYSTEPYGKQKKIAIYFIAETNVEEITLPVGEELGKPEHDEWKWMTYDQAKRASNPRIQKVLQWAKNIVE